MSRPGGLTHVVVPLDTREDGKPDGPIGNHLGLVRVPLQSGAASPVDALDAAIKSTSRKRLDRWKRFWRVVDAGQAERAGDWAHLRVAHPLRSGFAVSGLRISGQLTWNGRPFEEAIPLPWLPPGGSCFTLLTSYQGTTTMSVLTHGGTFEPARLAELWKDAVMKLDATLTS